MSDHDQSFDQPLNRWQQAWRIVIVLAVSTLTWWEVAGYQWREARAYFWIDLALGLMSFALMFWRRRFPFTVAMVTTLVGIASVSAAGPGLLTLLSLATRRRLTQIIPVGVVGILVGQLFYYYQPGPRNDPPWVNFTVLVVVTIAIVATGMYIGSRRELVWTLRERARSAEAEQGLRLAQAQSSERERIAREMHDVLAHRISLVSMHAGALAYRTDLTPAQVHETAELIHATSIEALTDLREVLGTLRRDEAARPQPAFADIGDLVEETEQVTLSEDVGAAVPDRVGRTAYRIVQEGLTNARKHAPGQPVQVDIAGAPGDGLRVTIHNDRPWRDPNPRTGGLGLVGMRERVEISGGQLTVRDEDTGFSLEAWLPWPR